MVFTRNGKDYMPELFRHQSSGSPTYPENYPEEPRTDSPPGCPTDYWTAPMASPEYPEVPTNDWQALVSPTYPSEASTTPEPTFNWNEESKESTMSPQYEWSSPTYPSEGPSTPQTTYDWTANSAKFLEGGWTSPKYEWESRNDEEVARRTSAGTSMEHRHGNSDRSRRSSPPTRRIQESRHHVRFAPYSRQSDCRGSRRSPSMRHGSPRRSRDERSRRSSPPRRRIPEERRRRDSRREDHRRSSYRHSSNSRSSRRERGHREDRDRRVHEETRHRENYRRTYYRS